MQTSLIIGGNRFVGPLIAQRLIKLGHKVILFNRGSHPLPPELETQVVYLKGDRRNMDDLVQTVAYHPDFVIDMCCYESDQAALAISLFGKNIRRYIYMSSAAVYKTPRVFPIQETDELGSWPIWGEYGWKKAKTDETFLYAFREQGFPVIIIRPTYILGPGNYVEREVFFLTRLDRGVPVVIPGDGRALVQFVFAEDVAESVVRLIETSGVEGEVLNCAGDQFMTLVDFAELCAELLKRECRLLHVDIKKFSVSVTPFLPTELSPFPNEHYIVANTKIKNILKIHFMSIEDGMKKVVEWYLSAKEKFTVRLRPREIEVLRWYGFDVSNYVNSKL